MTKQVLPLLSILPPSIFHLAFHITRPGCFVFPGSAKGEGAR